MLLYSVNRCRCHEDPYTVVSIILNVYLLRVRNCIEAFEFYSQILKPYYYIYDYPFVIM